MIGSPLHGLHTTQQRSTNCSNALAKDAIAGIRGGLDGRSESFIEQLEEILDFLCIVQISNVGRPDLSGLQYAFETFGIGVMKAQVRRSRHVVRCPCHATFDLTPPRGACDSAHPTPFEPPQ